MYVEDSTHSNMAPHYVFKQVIFLGGFTCIPNPDIVINSM